MPDYDSQQDQQELATQKANNSYQPFSPPQKQAEVGLNSVFVYGENLQATLGLNQQVFTGSNVQLVLNPSALAEAANYVVPPVINALCGGGSGGNMQFCIGSNTTLSFGRQYQVTFGSQHNVDWGKLDKSTLAKAAAVIILLLISATVLAWNICYNEYGDDEDSRAEACLICQTVLNTLLAVFVAMTAGYDGTDKSMWLMEGEFFQAKGAKWWQKVLSGIAGLVPASIAAGIGLEALIVPAIHTSKDEQHWLTDVEGDSDKPFINPSEVWGSHS